MLITDVATAEDWLDVAVIIDLFPRRVDGWALQDPMARSLVLAALGDRWPTHGVVHHSDRGSQYARDDYRNELTTTV